MIERKAPILLSHHPPELLIVEQFKIHWHRFYKEAPIRYIYHCAAYSYYRGFQLGSGAGIAPR